MARARCHPASVSDLPFPSPAAARVSPVALLVSLTAAAGVAAAGAVLAFGGAGSVVAVAVFAGLAVLAERLGQSVYGATTVSLSAVPVVAAAAGGGSAGGLRSAGLA